MKFKGECGNLRILRLHTATTIDKSLKTVEK